MTETLHLDHPRALAWGKPRHYRTYWVPSLHEDVVAAARNREAQMLIMMNLWRNEDITPSRRIGRGRGRLHRRRRVDLLGG